MLTALPAPAGAARFSSLHSRVPFWGASGGAGAGYSFSAAFTAESDFDWIRLLYTNFDTVNPSVITSAAVAVSSSVGDTINPVNAAGAADPTLWAPVTFNNAGAGGFVPSPTGSTRNLTLPVATAGTLAGSAAADSMATMGVSDWIPMQSLTRTDGGRLPLIFTRSFSSGVQNCPVIGSVMGITPVGGGGFDPYANGRIVRAAQTPSDIATTPGTVTTGSASAYLSPIGVQYLSRKRGLSCLYVGDSLYQGFGTVSQQNNPFHIAATALSTPGFPITAVCGSYSGMSSKSFQTNAYSFLKLWSPDVVFIKGESPNDTVSGNAATVAIYENSLARVLAFASYCVSLGIIPVLATAQPWAYTGAAEANRLTFNAAIRSSGWLYVDFDAVLSDGGSPAKIQAGYNSPTFPLHYNDAGSIAAAASVQAILQRILASRPR